MPFDEPALNRLEMFNEATIVINSYFMFLYSDGQLLQDNPGYPEHDEKIIDVEARSQVGWANVGCLVIIVLVNMGVILSAQIVVIYKRIKFCKLKKKNIQKAKELKAALMAKLALKQALKK